MAQAYVSPVGLKGPDLGSKRAILIGSAAQTGIVMVNPKSTMIPIATKLFLISMGILLSISAFVELP
jgi:hypothetical protein